MKNCERVINPITPNFPVPPLCTKNLRATIVWINNQDAIRILPSSKIELRLKNNTMKVFLCTINSFKRLTFTLSSFVCR